MRNNTVRHSPPAFDSPASTPTLVFEQTLLHQNRDHSAPIHREVDSKLFYGLTVVCKKIAQRH
jgi:hypothetical protein